MNSKLLYILLKSVFISNHLVSFLCCMCSRLDEHEALFARVQCFIIYICLYSIAKVVISIGKDLFTFEFAN